MITLHGFAASNYYNLVKHVLLYKQIPFQEHLVYGGSEALSAINPAAKVPVITTENEQHIAESSVICDFLEETYPNIPLYPKAASERALVRQIMKTAELYLELPSRRLLRYAFTGKQAPEALKKEIKQTLSRGITAMKQLCQFSPWIAGEQFSMADIYVYYVNTVVYAMGENQLEWDPLAELPEIALWRDSMAQSQITQTIETARQANMPEFLQKLQQQFNAASA